MNLLYYRTRLWENLTPEYVADMAERFHFREEDIPLIEAVARDIRGCIKDQEALEIILTKGYADVAITLGSNLDLLMDKYSRKGMLLEQLAAENIISDILMKFYNQVTKIVEEESGLYAGGSHFWGAEKNLPLEELGETLKSFQKVKLTCTKDFSLRPAKSVVYRMNLLCTRGADEGSSICQNCPNQCDNKESFCRDNEAGYTL